MLMLRGYGMLWHDQIAIAEVEFLPHTSVLREWVKVDRSRIKDFARQIDGGAPGDMDPLPGFAYFDDTICGPLRCR